MIFPPSLADTKNVPTTEVTMELEGADKPACVAETVARRFI